MPHRILILPDGTTIVEEHDGEGNRVAEPHTIKEMLAFDHAPADIIIQQPSLELTQAILKAVEKVLKKKK